MLRIEPRKFSSLLAAFVALSVAACGGPLSVTYDDFDPGSLDASKRGELDKLDRSVNEAAQVLEGAKSALDEARTAVDTAEAAIDQAEADLEVAEKAHELEEAKVGANKEADVDGAKSATTARETGLALAKARKSLADAKAELAEALADEAHWAWVVALAERELARLKLTGGSGPDHTELEAKLEKQVADASSEKAEAKEERARREKAVEVAQAEVKEASE